MRTRSIKSALLAGVIALGLAVAQQAEATSLVELSVEQMTDASTYIVRGEVTSMWSEVDDDGYIWTRVAIDVDHVIKGADTPDTLVVDSVGGVYGDKRMQVHSTARFSMGEEAIFFLDRLPSGKFTPVGMFQGKYTVRRAPGEDRQHVVRFNAGPNEPYDHRFLVHPPEGKRFYVDDLIGRIEARLDSGWDGQKIPGIAPERLQQINTLETRRRK